MCAAKRPEGRIVPESRNLTIRALYNKSSRRYRRGFPVVLLAASSSPSTSDHLVIIAGKYFSQRQLNNERRKEARTLSLSLSLPLFVM